MSEKINFVLGFFRSALERCAFDSLVQRLSEQVLQSCPRSWIVIEELSERRGIWPPLLTDLRQGAVAGVFAAYPTETGDSNCGAVLITFGSEFGTVTVSLPVALAEKRGQWVVAEIAATIGAPFGARFCAVGNELVVDEYTASVSAEALRMIPEVDLVLSIE